MFGRCGGDLRLNDGDKNALRPPKSSQLHKYTDQILYAEPHYFLLLPVKALSLVLLDCQILHMCGARDEGRRPELEGETRLKNPGSRSSTRTPRFIRWALPSLTPSLHCLRIFPAFTDEISACMSFSCSSRYMMIR